MTKDTAPSEFIGSTGIANWLDTSRTQAWRLMTAGEFGELVDISPTGSVRSQLRVRRANVQDWIDRRGLKAS
jgi:predicted DNA-binding transcriptional regulator AlpA